MVSIKQGDERAVLRRIEASPRLLSSPTTRLSLVATTPLHFACKRKRVEAVQEVLLFLTSSPLAVVREALRPYCRRADLSPPASVPEGVRMAVNMANNRGQTPLMYACYAGCPELVRLLLAHGADPWVGDRTARHTALHYAAIAGSAACIRELLRKVAGNGAVRRGTRYVDARSDCGLTALHYAVYLGDLAAVHELLRHGPNLNAATSSDVLVTCEAASTPLHFAAVRGNTEAARELLAYYARLLQSDPHAVVDPRSRANGRSQLPWQVATAHHSANRTLAALLHPHQPIHEALAVLPSTSSTATAVDSATVAAGLGDGDDDGSDCCDPRVGPPALAVVAGAALRTKLSRELGRVACLKRTAAAAAAAVDGDEAERLICHPLIQEPNSKGSLGAVGGVKELPAATVPGKRNAAAAAEAQRLMAAPAASELGQGRGSNSGASSVGGRSNSSNSVCPVGRCRDCWPPEVTAAGCCCGGAVRPDASCRTTASTSTTTSYNRASDGPSCCCGGATAAASAECCCCGGLAGQEGQVCRVCFAAPHAVAPEGCGHGLCLGCADILCRGVQARPLLCPFCRKVVTGFAPFAAAPAMGVRGQEQECC